jgi:signal peptidase II
MAWGTEIPEPTVIILTLFRLVAVGGIGYWLWDSVERKDSSNYLIVAVLILAGAFGNIIDSVFYGVILMTVILNYIVFRTALWRLFSR